MVPLQNTKFVSVTPPQAIVDNDSWTTAYIDTLGYDYCTIICYLGATDIAMTALKVQECDTSGGTYADVTGLVFGTSTNTDGSTSALPSATDDNKFQIFEIDCRGRKRYLDVTATIDDGTAGGYLTILAILSKASDAPVTATERGADEILRV